ncbi:hypothetical protein [Methanothrix sp.]|jgi:hypothetical protein|uniref:hypothetical protein n=1 Tax=Methanothrix sp. TaxID=90426 RepID=UPI0032AF28B9
MAPSFPLVAATALWGFVLAYGGLFQIREEFGLPVALLGIVLTGIIMFAWLRESMPGR